MISVRGANFTLPALIKSLLFADVGFGDAYMKGDITVDGDLSKWLENNQRERLMPYIPTTTRKVAAHYDISPEFYEILLGESMSYTCANWDTPEGNPVAGLNHAQFQKHCRHLSWLGYSEDSGVKREHLDCGSGWGSFMDLIKTVSPESIVDGLTLSDEQATYVYSKHPELDAVYVGSWRAFYAKEHYDTFSAIGMLEHVGKENLSSFFAWINTVLKPEGVGVLQFCSREAPISRWTDKHIFPGAYPPSFGEVQLHMLGNDLEITDYIECGRDYVRTLRCWLDNLESNISQIKDLGYDDSFIRMFRLYLNGGICSFRTGKTKLIQLRFEKRS